MLKRKALPAQHQRGPVRSGQRQPVVTLNGAHIDQTRKLANQQVTLVEQRTGIEFRSLQLGDLSVQSGNLAGENVHLLHVFADAPVQAAALQGKIVGRVVEGAGQVGGGGQYALPQAQDWWDRSKAGSGC